MPRASVASSQAAIQAVLPTSGTWFLDVSNADPTTTGATGLATTRQAFTPSTGSAAVPSVVSNTNTITVPTAGTTAANYVMIYSAATGGTYRIGAPLTAPVTSTSIVFAPGSLEFTAS